MRIAVALVAVVACRSESAPVVTVAPVAPASAAPVASSAPAPWPDARRVSSADGSFALEYPSRTFVQPRATKSSIRLATDVSEPAPSGEGELAYSIELTKLDHGPLAELKKELDAGMFHEHFPDGTEASFRPENGFLARPAAHHFVLSRGVEGIGDELHVFTTKDGTTWRFDCNYCCGMVDHPKMTMDAQLALCGEVLAEFWRERDSK